MSFFAKTFLLLLTVFSFSIQTTAATGPQDIPELKEKVYYNVTPERPSVGDMVRIEAQMFGTDVKDSDFVWKIGGKSFKEGVGINRAEFILGEKTKVDLTITTATDITIQKSFEFDPKKVVIIWESRTFTPPFYKGKSLHTSESSVILNAINLDQENPLTNTYNSYTWSIDGTVKGNESGVGYSSYAYQSDLLGLEPLFKVAITGVLSAKDRAAGKTTGFAGESMLRVQAFPTEVMSFEKSPLLGVTFNKTVKPVYDLNASETTIVSYPLYFSLSTSLAAVYEWYINDVRINSSVNELSFKKKKDNEQSRLSLTVKNLNAILQTRDMTYIIDTTK